MELQTQIEIQSPEERITYDSRILMLGSCFAENVGKKLKYFRFTTDVNPFGIVYNPLSVRNVLDCLIEKRVFTEQDLLWNDGKWVSLFHHGSFSSPDASTCLEHINVRLQRAAENIRVADWLMITFGTSWVYRHLASGSVAGNCHKLPAGEFERYRLSISEIVEAYTALITRLTILNPNLKILFTVSPIRHWKDGAHGNQLSKSVLLLAIDELVRQFKCAYYFPSYEIVMDELRDYRFYAEDMLHISETGIEYIWNRFKEKLITPESYDFMKRIEKLNRGFAHRTEDTTSEAYQNFLSKLLTEQEELKKRLPGADFD
ncbi:GSCFA domain-containing protein [Odoribacter sp. OttesenSCG-928-G04]|nr:GSCFA domain-containing protein [Odoribacter sp. OttesenSCG-928-G04]